MKLKFRGKSKIFVTGIGKNTGTTTIALLIAGHLAKEEKTAYVQLTEGLDPYYYLAMDKKEDWKSLYHASNIRNSCNMIEKVNCVVKLPDDSELSDEQKRRLLNQAAGNIIVCDSNDFLDEADLIIAVLDPLPSKILQNISKIKELKKMEYEGYEVEWIINRMNKGVSLTQIKKSLKLNSNIIIEYFDPAAAYANEYSGEGILSDKRILKAFENLLKEF